MEQGCKRPISYDLYYSCHIEKDELGFRFVVSKSLRNLALELNFILSLCLQWYEGDKFLCVMKMSLGYPLFGPHFQSTFRGPNVDLSQLRSDCAFLNSWVPCVYTRENDILSCGSVFHKSVYPSHTLMTFTSQSVPREVLLLLLTLLNEVVERSSIKLGLAVNEVKNKYVLFTSKAMRGIRSRLLPMTILSMLS